MSYFELFRGGYEDDVQRLEKRRQDVIDAAKALEPKNLDELLAADEDGQIDYDLEWVNVPNPWRPELGGTITVKPVLACTTGYPDAEAEKDRYDKGAWKLSIEARLPTGDSRYMGDLAFSYRDGQLEYTPSVTVNTSVENDFAGGYTTWESADAQLFLTLAESALAAQSE